MCKEMPVIPVCKVMDPKRIIGNKWRAEEEERHKGALTQKIMHSERKFVTVVIFIVSFVLSMKQ
jgi:hypothetical protein